LERTEEGRIENGIQFQKQWKVLCTSPLYMFPQIGAIVKGVQ